MHFITSSEFNRNLKIIVFPFLIWKLELQDITIDAWPSNISKLSMNEGYTSTIILTNRIHTHSRHSCETIIKIIIIWFFVMIIEI